jgi:oligosaccharyl transferase (archaeosortase A-associated)
MMRLSTTAVRGLVAVAALVALAVRVAVAYRVVLGQEYVAFIENDAWYHMRLVDGLIATFPWRIWEDQYLLHPGGESVNVAPMFDWLIAGVALMLGAGSPSPRLVDMVGAFMPPFIGALTVWPVFVLGRDLVSARAGLLAAWCLAVMPSEALLRSVLGFTDHHCLEVLLTTSTLMFLVRAIDTARTAANRRVQALAAGLSLAMYLFTWGGGSLFVLMLVLWAVTELLLHRIQGEATHALIESLGIMFVLPALMLTPWLGTRPFFEYHLLALAGGLAGVTALYVLGRLTLGLARGQFVYFALIAAGIVSVAAVVLVAFGSGALDALAGDMRRLAPWRASGYVSEAAPLMRSAEWRPFPLWNQFTASLPLAVAGALVLARRRRPAGVRLILWWTLVSLLATVGQVRFIYYLAIGVALLAGAGGDALLRWFETRSRTRRALVGVATVALVAIIALPGSPGLVQRSGARGLLSADWFDALQWMRSNTPEPFQESDAYVRGTGTGDAYGVLAWWDYGYWITRLSRRIPVTNPRQTAVADVASFLLESDPARARQALADLDARYVVVDAMLQISASRLPQHSAFLNYIAVAAGRNPVDYCEVLRPIAPADADPAYYCYPEYYKTMAIRLYGFSGRAATPRTVWVIDVEPAAVGVVPRVRAEWSFSTYEQALRFTERRRPGQLRIASKEPLQTCVPLEAMPDLVRVYRSVGQQGATGPPLVQVYERRGAS